MATIQEAILARLDADEDVTAAYGHRFFPVIVPDNAPLPALAYRLAKTYAHTYGNAGTVDSVRLTLTTWAKDYAEAHAAAETIRAALDGVSGTLSAIVVGAILLESETDIPSVPVGNEEARAYGVEQGFDVQHEE